ncbi:MAG TPA: hypothetical protein VM074_05495 [Solimonas sp.]|nr:hypothetical protein [Solimonas sp.]
MSLRLSFESRLAAPAAQVWAQVSTMAGVNAELMPLLRMSYPAEYAGMTLSDAPIRQVIFHSWLLLLGVLPFDRHALQLERVYPMGFDERSSSWMQRVWIHRRRVEPDGDGCRVTDELEIEPRLPFAGVVVGPVVRAIFAHRHRRLRARFGAL